ncbi:hypothetical protein QBC35DRAFT_517156 [Podospora australis]|uniref:VASt domain-containing protein n=1 Tax=Podospora australis TaxID=1536484 RepID=A0AAN7AF94_9PEZI|nr:hypothetical protein QBC35DRAFT_517156 [Podospora australis]
MDSTTNGLGKLLPKALAAKRRRNKTASINSNDDVVAQGRGRGASGSLRSVGSSLNGDGPSSETSSLHDTTSNTNNHESSQQQGNEETDLAYNLETQPSDFLASSEVSRKPIRSSTLPQESSDSFESTSSSLRKSRTRTLAPSGSEQSTRSPSGNRLRDVFRSKRDSDKDKSASDDKVIHIEEVQQPAQPATESHLESKSASGRSRRLSRGPKLEPLRAPPQTPPQSAAPIIVNTPPTPIDPPPPVIVATTSSPKRADASPVGNMIAQRRRAGSAGPSKLSTVSSAPLTPTLEAGPASPNPASTFFSSMFSAVQNTANQLSNTISTANLAPPNKKGASVTTLTKDSEPEQDNVEVESSSQPETSSESKEPAVKTLGMGDLSLSQLGIAETAASNQPSPVYSKFADSDSRNRSESAPADPTTPSIDVTDDSHLPRPQSLYSGDRTPPAGSMYEGKTGGIHRSGSIRSALGHRRNRGSSIATHNTTGSAVGAAISAANSSIGNPHGPNASVPKLTGFAVATKKRNRDFHAQFKSVPDDDYLIDDYSCALQREILAHGRLYVSEGHLCFSSNIFGWTTTVVMSFDEIVSVEKRSTALVFKNGLEISTLHAKHVFASFASRDTTYDLIIKIWKLGHPHLQSSLNGVRLEEPGGDRTEKIEVEEIDVSVAGSHSISGSDVDSDDGDDEDVYDEDEEDGGEQDAVEASDAGQETEGQTARKVSGAPLAPMEKSEEGGAPASGGDFPGPAAHAPTDCGDPATHHDKILGDEVIPAPLGKVYNLLFGPGSAAWVGKFLTEDQKCFDLQMEDKRGLTDEIKSRTFTYIKPLGGAIGPKQTKCIVTETLDSFDLEKSVNISCSTQNPDVPSGNIFVVKTKYCLSWGENNGTRVQANFTIEWSGKSWLKGPIEKGTNDGQAQYIKDLFASLRAAVSSSTRASGGATGGARGKKRSRKVKSALASSAQASDVESSVKISSKQSWGLFEPARPFLGPVVDIIRPILTGNVVYGLLVGLLVASWYGFGTRQGPMGAPFGRDLVGYANYPQRMAAYEEMWSREESDLWEWIEDRAGLDRLHRDPLPRKKIVNPRAVEEKLREERMSERELQEAIKVTEEHLQVLKSVVDRKSGAAAGSEANKDL